MNEAIQSDNTVVTQGLSSNEATQLLLKYGPNVLSGEKKSSSLNRFLRQFNSPVVITLLFATVLSASLGELVDAAAILVIVLINAAIGFTQEAKAEAAIEALKKMSAPSARALRDGVVVQIPAAEICLGDVLILEAGDYVPADAHIIIANQLSADESILTGESMPVAKSPNTVSQEAPLSERSDMLFSGTAVTTGSARAIVTATGMNTEMGHIAALLKTADQEQTPLQKRLEQVSRKLLWFCAGVVVVVFILGLFQGDTLLESTMIAISLAVAAIPEGLPAVVTLALAMAMWRMAKRNAIVRHLPAVETLGATSVICTDKTGTLTTGKMRVREVVLSNGWATSHSDNSLPQNLEFQALCRSAILCSNASIDLDRPTGDPTEVALLYLAQEHGLLGVKGRRLNEWSFDSDRKRMSVSVVSDGGVEIHVKGAPESILPLCLLNAQEIEAFRKQVEIQSAKGHRILAIANKKWSGKQEDLGSLSASEVERELNFLGLVAIADPPRIESIESIKKCRNAGIKVVMITGDHPITAHAIATELGIADANSRVLTGLDLEQMSEDALVKVANDVSVYARVTPEHKLRIVQALKKLDHIVAMTGDGVNDAPALKQASIGVAMGKGGTEVARQASSMVLADDNFATLVAGIEEGRAIFGNISRTIQYLLSGNLAEILIVLGAAALDWPSPLAPIHLLWINLVTDGLPSLALAAEPVPKDLLEKMNRPSARTFFNRRFYTEMTFVGIITTILTLGIYGYSLHADGEIVARTHAFSFLVFSELFRSFASRSDRDTYFDLGFFSNPYHLAAVAFPIAFQFSLHHFEWFNRIFKVGMISWGECVTLLALTLVPVTALEVKKLIFKGSGK